MSNDSFARLRGKYCLGLVRCSTTKQADTSIPDQIAALRKFANDHGLIIIDIIILEGVSGSQPGNREDLQQIIQRKRERDDFEVLLVQDTSRLTRGGLQHGNKIEFDFAAEGIEIVYVMEQLPEGPAGDLFKSFQYYSAKEHARSIAMNVARGSMSAMEQGRLSHARRIPYAVDRLYVGPDGKPRHVIRAFADGTQVKLHPATGEIIERFGHNPQTGKPAHYKKLADETVQLVPGDPKLVEVVRLIFRRYFIDRWGFARIAAELNRAKVLAAVGGFWHKSAVKKLIRNSIYTGIGIANRITAAVYYVRSPGMPTPAQRELKELANRKRPKTKVRPQTEWLEVPQAAMAEFLSPDVLKAAIEYQQRYWSDQEQGRNQPLRDRHGDSPYFLKGVLVSRQGGLAMYGRRSGVGKYRRRYYRAGHADAYPRALDPVFQRSIPAAPIEQIVLHLLQQVLIQMPNLKAVIKRRISREFASPLADVGRRSDLAARQLKLQQQREFVMENVDVVGKNEARQRLSRLNEEIVQVERELVSLNTAEPWDEDRVERTTHSLVELLRATPETLRTLPMVSLRRILELLLAKATVDLETRAVELEFRVPKWAVENPQALEKALGLKDTSVHEYAPEAQRQQGILLMKFRVAWLGDGYVGYGVAA